MSPQQARPTPSTRPTVRPRTDVFETPEALVLVADVPGADADSIELSLQDEVLVLRARSVQTSPEGWQPIGAEFELPDYERSFRLEVEIEREGLAASLHGGRLRVVLPKRKPRTERIPVQAR